MLFCSFLLITRQPETNLSKAEYDYFKHSGTVTLVTNSVNRGMWNLHHREEEKSYEESKLCRAEICTSPMPL